MKKFSRSSLICSMLLAEFFSSGVSAQMSPLRSPTLAMDMQALKALAFARCQAPYEAPVIAPVPELDPPQNGGPEAVGMVYQEELAVRTANLLDQNKFYFSPRPRAAVNSLPMDIYVDPQGQGQYQLKTWDDANVDYSNPFIQPPIDKTNLPAAGKVLTEMIIGHQSPQGDYPQLFDIRSSAYVRFAGFPPQVTGASMRLGAHRVFGQGAAGQSVAEDFPIVRALYVSTQNENTAHAFALVESRLFCGALSLDMSPKAANAEIVVDSNIYLREDFRWKNDPHTGLIAYSSMFWKKAAPEADDSAHDSDTMSVEFNQGATKQVSIAPPAHGLAVLDMTAQNQSGVRSWTLSNEDRNPAHYAHFKPALGNTNYDLRASYRVEILSSNVKTGVNLYQQATDGEYGDNIVAMSTLRQDVRKSQSVNESIHFKYRTSAFYPHETDQCGFIRDGLSHLPVTGGMVKIPPGTYECREKIVIKSNNVVLKGAGRTVTTLKLADRSPAPVLVIGDDQVRQDTNGNWVTFSRVNNVQVSDLTIDGNLANQDPHNECGAGICDGDVSNIRNNAITVRGASYVTIERVTVHSAISGGLVTEKYCDHLHVKDFSSYGNYFDGFAGYQTEDSLFENINLSQNHGAGISIDIDFNRNHFLNGTLAHNHDVGIFARHIDGVVFEKLNIINNGNHGAFLAQAEEPNTCANNNEFRAVQVRGSKGFGIFIADQCTGNKVTENSRLSQNSSGCYFVNQATQLGVAPAVVCQP